MQEKYAANRSQTGWGNRYIDAGHRTAQVKDTILVGSTSTPSTAISSVQHPFKAKQVAQKVLDHFVKLYGPRKVSITDRDKFRQSAFG